MSAPLTGAEVQAQIGFDDATRVRLETYLAMLASWQERMNLVGRSTLVDPWRRHVLDSAQIHPHVPARARTLVDIGSGAGFPGLVLAMLAASGGGPAVTLVEATQKKCVFLSEVARATETAVEIRAERVEALRAPPFDVVTARALAPVGKILTFARGLVGPHTVALLLKGGQVDAELTEAARDWKMRVMRHSSLSHSPDLGHSPGVLLELRQIHARKRV